MCGSLAAVLLSPGMLLPTGSQLGGKELRVQLVNIMSRYLTRTRRQDPLFGEMLYMGDRLKYWEAEAKFPPIAREVELFIDGSRDDDMEQQHEFFRIISEDWLTLSGRIQELFQKVWAIRRAGSGADRLWEQTSVSSISIPKASVDDGLWEISLTTPLDADHVFSVHMKGREPQEIVFDG